MFPLVDEQGNITGPRFDNVTMAAKSLYVPPIAFLQRRKNE